MFKNQLVPLTKIWAQFSRFVQFLPLRKYISRTIYSIELIFSSLMCSDQFGFEAEDFFIFFFETKLFKKVIRNLIQSNSIHVSAWVLKTRRNDNPLFIPTIIQYTNKFQKISWACGCFIKLSFLNCSLVMHSSWPLIYTAWLPRATPCDDLKYNLRESLVHKLSVDI